jgi:hypothetical protein
MEHPPYQRCPQNGCIFTDPLALRTLGAIAEDGLAAAFAR